MRNACQTAGSLAIVFVWVYYSAQIFLMGAEFTWLYAKTFGSMRQLQPAPAAATPTAVPGREPRDDRWSTKTAT